MNAQISKTMRARVTKVGGNVSYTQRQLKIVLQIVHVSFTYHKLNNLCCKRYFKGESRVYRVHDSRAHFTIAFYLFFLILLTHFILFSFLFIVFITISILFITRLWGWVHVAHCSGALLLLVPHCESHLKSQQKKSVNCATGIARCLHQTYTHSICLL